MKNFSIPPYVTLVIGVALMILGWLVLEGVIPQFFGFLGFILTVIGFAGVIGKLFKKAKPVSS